MREEEIIKIDNEITRLNEKLEQATKPLNPQIENYIWGRIDALKWVKENL